MKQTATLLAASLLLAFALSACGGGDTQMNPDDQTGSGITGGQTAPGDDQNGSAVTGGGQNGAGNGNAANNGTAGSGTGGTTGGVTGGADSGTAGGGTGSANSGSLGQDAKDALDDAGDALTEGGNAVGQSFRGASFDQMVRNGRVHDRDGDLKDRENSTTPGTSF